MIILEAFIAGVAQRMADEDASLSGPLRSGALDPGQYKHHTGQLAAFAKVREYMAAEYARLTEPQRQPKEDAE